jgi:hypothetical protein
MKLRKGCRVVQICVADGERFASPHPWVVTRVHRGVVFIGDAHGESRWTYGLDGRQLDRDPSFASEIVIIK